MYFTSEMIWPNAHRPEASFGTSTVLMPISVASAVMSGLFFVFSNFAMTSLARIRPEAGMSAMQAINVTIINPWFLALFMGTALGSLAVAIASVTNWGAATSAWALAGGLLYFLGCFLVTIRFNVPLNDRLAAVDPEAPGSETVWRDYVRRWLPWNHVRTVSTLLAAAAFLVALLHA